MIWFNHLPEKEFLIFDKSFLHKEIFSSGKVFENLSTIRLFSCLLGQKFLIEGTVDFDWSKFLLLFFSWVSSADKFLQ